MVIENGSLAITLVDHEPSVRAMLARALGHWKLPCQIASSAEEAIPLLEQHPTPVVLTDLQMPGKGGLWLIGEVRRRWPDTGIIVLSSGRSVSNTVDCLNAGAQRYFLKPPNYQELQHALNNAMETFQLKHERYRYQQHLERTVRRQTRKIRKTFLSAIESLVLALEARDAYTFGHSQRVRRYSMLLGKAIGLSSKDIATVALAAKLHDVGKVGIPETVLNKPGKLTGDELRCIQAHTVIGEQILMPIIHNKTILSVIRNHHERIDGRGYPDGLAGDQIPPLTRLLSVADCFDALTSSRPYRKQPMTFAEAAEVLREISGTQLEAAFVEVFTTCVINQIPRVAIAV